jgi:HAD superfamily hydrolase (TIGR01458 family)
MAPSLEVDALLLDIDGVLVTSWQALPGAVDAVAALRARGVPFRLLTNTTTHSRSGLAETLRHAGFDFEADEIVTAVTATAAHLKEAHAGAKVFVLTDGDPRPDLSGVELVDVEDADVVVLGGGCDEFSYDVMNRAFRRLEDGAAFVAMHRNLYWRTREGLQLDGGAFVAALEAASGVSPVVCGKPAEAYFLAALGPLGVEPARAAMVGDDVVNDVGGAQAAGLAGVLVRTGKFRPADLDRGAPDAVVDSLADVPSLMGLGAQT